MIVICNDQTYHVHVSSVPHITAFPPNMYQGLMLGPTLMVVDDD